MNSLLQPKSELERLLEENRRLRAMSPIMNSRATTYVWAIVILCIAALAFVIGITIARPQADNTALITIGLGVLAPILAALMAATVQQVHQSLNGRLTQLLQLTHAEGMAIGVEQERARTEAKPPVVVVRGIGDRRGDDDPVSSDG